MASSPWWALLNAVIVHFFPQMQWGRVEHSTHRMWLDRCGGVQRMGYRIRFKHISKHLFAGDLLKLAAGLRRNSHLSNVWGTAVKSLYGFLIRLCTFHSKSLAFSDCGEYNSSRLHQFLEKSNKHIPGVWVSFGLHFRDTLAAALHCTGSAEPWVGGSCLQCAFLILL